MTQKKQPQIPDYVTPEIEGRIREMIKRDDIHPRHHACDFTLEVAAGADLKAAIKRLVQRHRDGAYDSLYTRSSYTS